MESNGRDRAESIAGDSLVSTDPSTFNVSQFFGNELPNFEIEQVQLQFGLQNSLKRLRVQSNMMFLITDTTVFKISLDNPSDVASIAVPSVGDDTEVTNCWLHSNGLHLILQINHKSYYYLHDSYSKFKLISRFKNLNIEHIAFSNDKNNIDSTGDFLVGTSDGTVYLSFLKAHDPISQGSKRDDKYVKQVYKSPSLNAHLYGLTFSNNILINLIVDNQLLTWECFDTSYSELIKVFKFNPRITSLPSNTSTKSLFEATSKSFTYIVPGTGDLVSNDDEIQLSQVEKLKCNISFGNSSDSLISSNHHLLLLDNRHNHLIIFNKLSANEPIVIKLNSKINPQERILGLIADNNADTYWLYTNNNIYEIVIVNESISVWYNYYKMGKYEEAIRCLENQDQDNFFKKDMVQIKQGYDYLQKGGFGIAYSSEEIDEELLNLQIKGITVLAKLTEPFEKICLMLLNLQQSLSTEPKSSSNYTSEILLIEYLQVKFDIAKNKEKNKIRMIVLSSWIIELMLRVLYNLKTEVDNASRKETITISRNSGSKEVDKKFGTKESMYSSLDKQFHLFLNRNYKVLDSKTVYQIMRELHFPSKLITFSELIEDYEFILSYYIDIENWDQALATLIKIYTKGTEEDFEIIYKSSTVLLVNHTKKTVETWLKFSDLKYERFIPAILTYNKNNDSIPFTDNYTIHFLQKVIDEKGVKNEYVNNTYFSLLITYPILESLSKKLITKQIIKVLNYMKNDSAKKSQQYDPDFILRLCLRYKQYQPAILILIDDMALFEQALKLALDNELTELGEFVLKRYDEFILNTNESSESRSFQQDYEFIYSNADTEEDIGYVGKIKLEEESFSSRKKLWMMFAKYLITGVCAGKDFKILDIIDNVEFVHHEKPTAQENGKADGVQSITKDLVRTMTGDSQKDDEIVSQIDLKKLNKVLKYLLNLSYSSNRGSNVLTLKDLLPMFPESIMINNFKDEIVLSLNQYNNRINHLTLEMQESSNIAHQLKTQIKESTYNSNRGKIYTIIEPGEPCKLCDNLLISKNFICFPSCHHSYHKECLVKYYLRLKGDYRFKKVFQNFKKNSSQSNKKELDDIMLKSCVLCNEGNINSIDFNLIDITKDKAEIDQWVL